MGVGEEIKVNIILNNAVAAAGIFARADVQSSFGWHIDFCKSRGSALRLLQSHEINAAMLERSYSKLKYRPSNIRWHAPILLDSLSEKWSTV